MHPTGRPLDAEFQPAASTAALPPDGPPSDGTEMIIQDFNSFFEKLSGLDDVRWSEEPKMPPPATASGAQSEPKRTAQPSSNVPAAGMSTAPQAPRGMAKSPPGASGIRPPAPAAVATPVKRPGLPLGFKLAMMALFLFAVGMGAGWMALSLPHTADAGKLPENPLVAMDSKPAAAPTVPTTEPAPSARHEEPAPAQAAGKSEGKQATVAENDPAQIAEPGAAGDEPEAFSQPGSEPVTGAKAPKAAGQPKPAPRAAARSAAKAATGAHASAAPQVGAATDATARYALQVGACSSARCVEIYRTLIQPHVGAHPVHVVDQQTAGAAPVQRVRVEPLTKDQALALKQALEQADPRLKQAYIVRTADRS